MENGVFGDITLYSAMNGAAKALCEVGDYVFAAGMLGQGVAFEPSDGRLFAPCDGVITRTFDTSHAVSLKSDGGAEILLHIGIDTAKLGGSRFRTLVSRGDRVKRGELLIAFDMDAVKRRGFSVTTPMIVRNSREFGAITPCAGGHISAGNEVLRLKR